MMRSTTGTRTIRNELLPLLRNQEPELRGNQRVWKLTVSDTWYQHPSQIDCYNHLTSNPSYALRMHGAEEKCFSENKMGLQKLLPKRFSLVDLGPGDGTHTFTLMKAADLIQRISYYYPTDISDEELRNAVSTAGDNHVPVVVPIKRNFMTELDNVVARVSQNRNEPSLYNLGATLVNFDRDVMLTLLRDSVQAQDFIYVSAQLVGRNAAEIEVQYCQDGTTRVVAEVMKSLGFEGSDFILQVEYDYPTKEIWISATLSRIPGSVRANGKGLSKLHEGDKVVVLRSYKPRLLEFEELVGKYFDGMVFTDKEETYAGFIGTPRKVA